MRQKKKGKQIQDNGKRVRQISAFFGRFDVP